MRFHFRSNYMRRCAICVLVPALVLLPGRVAAQPAPVPAPAENGPTPQPRAGGPATGLPFPTNGNEGRAHRSGPFPPSMSDSSNAMVGPLKFGDLTVDAAIDLLEQWTGRIVLRPQALPATSLVLSINHPIPKAEAVQALETILSLNNIAVAPMGDKFLKVTPLAQARSEAPELIEGSTLGLPPSGRIAVKLFQFQFLTASELMPQLASLLTPGIGAAPVVVEKANAALVTDTISNLQRIEKLIDEMDRPALNKLTPKFYNLTNAKASDVANSIRSLLSGNLAAQVGSTVTIQSDDRTNQVIVVCDPRQLPFFDELIDKLNSKGETNTRQDVIQLKHAVAKDVATLLTQLVAGRKQATTTGTGQIGQAQTAAQQAAAARRNIPGAAPGAPPPTTVPAATAAAALQSISGEGVTEFSPLLTILSEDRSNSLVVSGTVDDINIIKELVSKLDILLAQVRIEVLICEVTLDDSQTSGISALGLQVTAGKLTGFNGNSAGLNVGTAVDGSGFATFDTNHDLSAVLGLSTTPRKSNLTVLSVPTIVTTHNKEATIFVGESDPVITGYVNNGTSTTTATGGIGAGFNSTVTYKDIGIQLKVTPLIGNDGTLELQIAQEVNSILREITIDGNQQPVIGKRSTESFVSARDGEIIVLGGLQTKQSTYNTNRLGPIPIVGDLLGSRTHDKTRTDLVFFLRPHILTNTPEDNAEAFKRVEQGKQGDEVRVFLHHGQSAPKSN